MKTPENLTVVGRTNELAWVHQWLQDGNPSTLLAIGGPAGIGKSTLLAAMAYEVKALGYPAWLVDGRYVGTPASFLDYLKFLVSDGASEQASSRLLIEDLTRQPGLLLIDNAEGLGLTGAWLRTAFLPRLHQARFLIGLAARTNHWWEWSTDPVWAPRFRMWTLAPFTFEETQAYLATRGVVEDEWGSRLYHQTGGHPLSLALATDAVRSDPSVLPTVAQVVTARVLREVVTERWVPLLEALAVIQEADERTLAEMSQEPVGTLEYHHLLSLSFVSAGPLGLRMHDTVRKALLDDLRQRSWDRFQMLRRRAVEVLGQHRETADEATRRRTLAIFLDLYRDQLPEYPWYKRATIDDWDDDRAFVPSDLPYLRALVPPEPHIPCLDPALHNALLNEMVTTCPEAIRVVRNASHEPVGFWAGLWLSRETLPILQRYVPGFLSMWPENLLEEQNRPKEQADTCFTVFFCYRADPPRYTAEEVAGLVLYDSLVTTGGGVRVLVTSVHPSFLATIARLGGQTQRVRDPVSGQDLEVLVGDKRGRGFLAFARFLETRASSPSLKSWEPVPELDQEAMHTLLASLHDYRRFAAVARTLHLSGGAELARKHLLDLLEAETPLEPLTPGSHKLLRHTYLVRNRTVHAIAMELHLSRSTYYRHRQTALAECAQAWNLERSKRRNG